MTTATVSWTAGSPVGSATVTYYWVVGTSSSVTYGSGIAQGFTTGLSATATGLTCGTTYYLRVYAQSSCNGISSAYKTSSAFSTALPATPTATATPASVICGSTSQINAVSAGNIIKWYTVSTGGTSIGTTASGVNFAVTPAATTTYYAEAVNGTCVGTTRKSVLVTVTVPTTPSGYAASPTTILCGESSSLTATSAGASIRWYTVSTGGTAIGTMASGGSFSVSPLTTTTYYAESFTSACTNTTRKGVKVTVSQPAAPTYVTANPTSVVCGGTSQLKATSSGATIKWYTVATGGTSIGSSASAAYFTVAPSTTTTYYAEANRGTCVYSTRVAVVVTTTLPPTPSSVTATPSSLVCGSTTQLKATSTGSTIDWYTVSTGGTSLGSSASAANFAVSPASTTTYYAQASNTTCTNPTRTAVVTTVSLPPLPSSLSATPSTIACGATSQIKATSTGYTITWYTVSTGGTSIGTSASAANFTVSPQTTTTYYAEATNGTCSNPTRTAVVVTVTLPTTPTSVTATPASVTCGSSSQLNATSAGNTIKWFTVSSGGTQIGTSASGVNFSVTPLATTTYYAEANSSSCPNPTRVAVVVSMTPPPVPSSASATPSSLSCGSTSQLKATSAGSTINWYTVSSGGSSLGSSASGASFSVSPTVTTTYYAESHNGVCYNPTRTAVLITVAAPALPSNVTASPSSLYCSSQVQLNAVSSGNTIKWYTVSSGGTSIGSTASGVNFAVTPASTTTYYAEANNGSCPNLNRISTVVTITPPAAPSAVSATPALLVCGSSSQLIATSSGNTIKWYTVSTGGAEIGTSLSGAVFAVSPVSTTTYWAEANNGSCVNSTRTQVVVTVSLPASPLNLLASPDSVVCGASSSLYATSPGNTIKWYTVPTGGTSIGSAVSGSDISVTPSSTTIYYAEANNGSCPNPTRPSITVTVIPPAAPSEIMATPDTAICNSQVTLNAVSDGNSISWYTVPTGGTSLGTSASGGDFDVSPATTTTYYAEAITGSCSNSSRTAIVVHIVPLQEPTSATADPPSVSCGQSTDLSALSYGNSIEWYNAASGGSPLGTSASGASFSVTPAGTTTYYAEAVGVACNSAGRTPVVVTVNAPAAPSHVTAEPLNVCVGSVANLSSTATGYSINWYDAASGGNLLGTSASDSVYTITVDSNTTVYAETSFSGTCLSNDRTPITVSVIPNPVGGTVSGGGQICPGNMTEPMTLSGYSGKINKWEISSDFGSSWMPLADTNNVYATNLGIGGTYWFRAEVSNGNCPVEKSGYAEVIVPTVQGIAMGTQTSISCNIASPNNWVDLVDAQNNLIVSLFDSTGNNNLGATMAYLTIDPMVNFHPTTGEPYLQRHVKVNVSSQGGAFVKLYFTQEELYSLMAVAPSITSASDLAVTKVSDMETWSNPKYFQDPILTVNDPFPGVYSLQVGVSEFSEFFIHGKAGQGPLPIELVSFEAGCKNGSAVLTWSTATELNNQYFTIERTTDMQNWTEAARVEGAGNSNHLLNYSAVDEFSSGDMVYYRLKQTDYDGKTSTSPAIPANCQGSQKLEVNAYPNPCRDELLISFSNEISKSANVMMYDASAKVIMAKVLSDTEIERGVTVLNVSEVIPGIYTVEFVCGKTKKAMTIVKTK
ncbi:MAG: T9SS type A sorting domain-containing protein [Bacteroidota bacterium]